MSQAWYLCRNKTYNDFIDFTAAVITTTFRKRFITVFRQIITNIFKKQKYCIISRKFFNSAKIKWVIVFQKFLKSIIFHFSS